MRRLYILCEGQAEDDFISIVLNPYLQSLGIVAIPIICTTKRTPIKKGSLQIWCIRKYISC
jgi:hypothetical protein